MNYVPCLKDIRALNNAAQAAGHRRMRVVLSASTDAGLTLSASFHTPTWAPHQTAERACADIQYTLSGFRIIAPEDPEEFRALPFDHRTYLIYRQLRHLTAVRPRTGIQVCTAFKEDPELRTITPIFTDVPFQDGHPIVPPSLLL